MTATFRAPLADFRLNSYPSAAAQATITCTAGTDTSIPNSNHPNIPVVMNISASLAAGTALVAPLQLNLIDGTTGQTPLRSWTMASGGTNAASTISESNLNIPCYSGYATLEFAGTSAAASQQAVNLSGFIKSYGDS